MVTGGAGFIGSNLADALIASGHQVVIVDNFVTGLESYVNPQAVLHKFDVCSAGLDKIFAQEKPEIVFHLAAQIDVRKSVEDPQYDNQVNVVGGLNVIEQCVRHGVKKIVFPSTAGVYGNTQNAASEDFKVFFDAPYAVHKFATEKNIELFSKIHNFQYVIFRPANVYGPRQYKGGEAGVISIFTSNLAHGKESIIYGDGKQTRDFLYVSDLVDAFLHAINIEKNGLYNLSSGREISIVDLAKIIEKISGKEFKYRHEAPRSGEIMRSVLNSAKMENLGGWQARVSLEEGIKKTLDWLKR